MIPRITRAEHIEGFRVRLEFSDGAAGVVDFESRIKDRGGVFEALQDPDAFAKFAIDEEGGTLVWSNGVDFCPVVLHALATGRSIAAA